MDFNDNQSGPHDSESKARSQVVFDDEPLEAILYGAPSLGPSSADLFMGSKQAIAVIATAVEQKDNKQAIQLMAELFETGMVVPAGILMAFVTYLRGFIPGCPCPLVEEHGVSYDRILKPCFEAGCRHGDPTLMTKAGTLLYRWYETFGFYQEASDVVSLLLERARCNGNIADEALLTNNLGYEYLLAQRWEKAAPYFKRAIDLYERLGETCEVTNIRSNSLTCEAGSHGIEYLVTKKKELIELACILRKRGDWRARKSLSLLARVREYEGKYIKAVLYARRAVKAGRRIPSRHYSEDVEYLAVLEAQYADEVIRQTSD